MMLKEYSGRPPPRISSRPGTPVGSCRMVTRSCPCVLMNCLDSSRLFVQQCVGPDLAHQAHREGCADESNQQPEQMADDRDCRVGGAVARISRELFKYGAVGLDLDALQRRDFRPGQSQGAPQQRCEAVCPGKSCEGHLELLKH